MTLEEALQFIKRHENLIGTIDEYGFTNGILIPVPINPDKRDSFIGKWLISRDINKFAAQYDKEEFEVWSIDTEHLDNADVLFYNKMEDKNE